MKRLVDVGSDYWGMDHMCSNQDIMAASRVKMIHHLNTYRKRPPDQSLVRPGKLRVRGVVVDQFDRTGWVPPSHPIKHQTAIYDEWHALAECSANALYRGQRST